MELLSMVIPVINSINISTSVLNTQASSSPAITFMLLIVRIASEMLVPLIISGYA